MNYLVAPSILAANFANLSNDIELVNASEADWFHIDVMDGVFVPNISFGFPVLKAIKEFSQKPLDVHLMIVEPDKWVEQFAIAGADVLTVHFEACSHLHSTIQKIKGFGMKAGVALNPHTPVNSLKSIIHDLDLVCLMSVNPGFGGQTFIPHTLDKIRELRELIDLMSLRTRIEIDGGVGMSNAEEILRAGADVLVAGSGVFKATNPTSAIKQLKNIALTQIA